MKEIEQHIKEWISKVSKLRPELGGFAVCPYASIAKFKIIQCNASEIEIVSDYDVIIYVVESNLTLKQVREWVEIYNSRYSDWKFFEDCACYNTYINGVQTNNGKYNLILSQPKEKLNRYRQILSKTDYYNYWDTEYLKEILQDDYKILDN